MELIMHGAYSVQTDVDCEEMRYGLLKYNIPDDEARYAIAYQMAQEYSINDGLKQIDQKVRGVREARHTRNVFKWLLDELDYTPTKEDEELVKEYYDTEIMREDLEILEVIKEDEKDGY